MISEDISADSSDYSLQSPALVTFPTGQSTTNFGITLFTDQISEADEEFLIKLKKTGNDYKLGQDSVCKIRIIGTLSVKNLKDLDLYKNSFDGTFNVKLPNDFNGTVVVYNNLGQEIITTSNTDVNQDLRKLTTQPNGVYRVMIHSKNKRIAKTIFN
jgi:sorbitol-specific phosphotransferase system component IIA